MASRCFLAVSLYPKGTRNRNKATPSTPNKELTFVALIQLCIGGISEIKGRKMSFRAMSFRARFVGFGHLASLQKFKASGSQANHTVRFMR